MDYLRVSEIRQREITIAEEEDAFCKIMMEKTRELWEEV